MDRIDIELALHRDRADALEIIRAMSEEERTAPRTRSEHDADSWWSFADHFIHTTLIERSFNEMVRRHVQGERGMDANLVDGDGGRMKPMADVLAYVHRFTEGWKREHEGKPLDELVRIGLATRADTLALLAELTDQQLASTIPGAPWGDGTVGSIMAAHAGHAQVHRRWAEDGAGPLAG